MRIPSQFNDESLYRGRKRVPAGAGPSYRRLFRLFVALVLVVVVMREAARPRHYQAFFGDPAQTEVAREYLVGEDAEDARLKPGEGHGGIDGAQTLRDELMTRVVDGSVWRSEDVDALYMTLATAHEIDPSQAARVSVLPLMQQPDVYRGQPVRFHGSVMRTEPIDAVDNPFGIQKYWNLWLRPADGGDRPLLAVVPSIPRRLETIGQGGDESAVVPVDVHVVGRFFKRLAYRSSIGADLAPVIVGVVVVANDTGASKPAEPKQSVSTSRLILGVVLACLIGLGIAVLTMWRTAITARRARILRHSTSDQSVAFLQAIDHVHDVEPKISERSES